MNAGDILFSVTQHPVLIDLTHSMKQGMPSWPTDPPYRHKTLEIDGQEELFMHYEISLDEHSGTHVDAPRHRYAEGNSIDCMPLPQFYGHAVKIEAAQIGKCGLLTKKDIAEWEAAYMQIRSGDIVVLHFGWDQFWEDKTKFLKNWPGISEEAARYLIDKQIKGVGTDALSIDQYGSLNFPAHEILLKQEITIIENLANLEKLPLEFFFMALPLKIEAGSGSPVRAVGWYNE